MKNMEDSFIACNLQFIMWLFSQYDSTFSFSKDFFSYSCLSVEDPLTEEPHKK